MKTLKNALIIGGTKGIGRAISLLLYEEFCLDIIYNSDVEAAQDMHEILLRQDKNRRFTINSVDASNRDSIIKHFKYNKKEYDCIVFCAGDTNNRMTLSSFNYENMIKIFNLQLFIPLELISMLPINDGGAIVFISSVLGEIPHATSLPYGIVKASINSAVKNLMKELSSKHIRINAVAPGFIDTDWHKNKSKEQIESINKRISLSKFGTTYDIAHAVKFIVDNKYINGTIVKVDGGYDYF